MNCFLIFTQQLFIKYLLYVAHKSRPRRAAVNKTSKVPALWNVSPWQTGRAVGETENKQVDKQEENFREHKHWEDEHRNR